MNLTRHRRRRILTAAFALFLLAFGGNSAATHARIQEVVSGIWDVQFSRTVQGAGTTQTDEFVIEVRQNGAKVTGTLRVQRLDVAFPLSGEVQGNTFTYIAEGRLSPTCKVTVKAKTTIDVAAGRLSGAQTQSTCVGIAVGQMTAARR